MAQAENSFVTLDQLQVGLYVYLDMKWFEHPFAFNHFKIKDAEQIRIIRGLGVKKIRYDPARSDLMLPAAMPGQAEAPACPEDAPPVSPETAAAAPETSPAIAVKRTLLEKLRLQRETAARIDAAFLDSAGMIRDVERKLQSHPEEVSSRPARWWAESPNRSCPLRIWPSR